jgi:predicted alpha/beta superfamily hydrolase
MNTKIRNLFAITLFSFIFSSCSEEDDAIPDPVQAAAVSKTESFTFSSNGTAIKGKIFVPAAFDTNKNLPAIYLIDFTEQHFNVAKDEFEKVIEGVQQLQGFEALVVTLEEHLDVDSNPGDFEEYYALYKNMTSYVDANYTDNTSRTFIARGSEGGLVLMTLFLEDPGTSVFDNFIATDSPSSFNSAVINLVENGNFPQDKENKRLHFSFSTSNNQTSCTNLINAINEAQYPWLQFESLKYTTSNFENTYPTAFTQGLKYIFDL